MADLYPIGRLANHFGLLRHIWHPGLLEAAVYMIVPSMIVLFATR